MTDWISSLAGEIQATMTEAVFVSHWALVEAYHQIGELIVEGSERNGYPIDKLVQELQLKVNRSERMLWYAVKFARQYPSLDKLPDGKSITWNKVINKYLTREPFIEAKPEDKHAHIWQLWRICDCGAREKVEDVLGLDK